MQGILKRIALLGALLAFAIPMPALAQDSVVGGYNETEIIDPPPVSGDPPADPGDPGDPSATGETASDETTAVAATEGSDGDDGGSLPFTGLDIGLLAVAGAGLLALGLAMRRLTRRPDAA